MASKKLCKWMESGAQWLIGATIVSAVCMALVGSGPSSSSPQYRDAMAAYQAEQWPQAYEALATLADAGNPDAARVAALMARQGPYLFGQTFKADAERLARWEQSQYPTEERATARLDVGDEAGTAPAAVQVAHVK